MIQASDLISGSAKSRSGPMSAQRNLHGYDGPLQFLSPAGNPDEMTTVQVNKRRLDPLIIPVFFLLIGDNIMVENGTVQ